MSAAASLSRSLLRRMLLGYCVMAVLLLGGLGMYEQRRVHRLIGETLQTLATTFSPAATSALWDYQTPVLEALAGGIGAHPVVVRVEVLDPEGRPLATWVSRKGLLPSQDLTVRAPLARSTFGGRMRPLGTLVVASSDSIVVARLVPTLVWGGAIALGLLLVVMGWMWLLVRNRVVRRLVHLEAQTRVLDPAHLQGVSLLAHDGPADEIGNLAGTLDSLRQRIQSHLEERQAVEAYISELNQSLYRAIARAEGANQAKMAFLRRMSHEFLTPLNHVQLHAELLGGEVRPEVLEDVRQIQASAGELAERVRDILDLVDLEAGGLKPQPSPLDPSWLAMELEAMARPWAEARGNSLRVALEALPRGVEVDGGMLLRVLAKLLHNACRFTKDGQIEVTGAEREGGLRFEVLDTGKGIEPEILEGVFQLFQQGDEGLTRGYGGLGLGLTICQRLVVGMEGRIAAESCPGQGSCFRIDLPKQARPPLCLPDSSGACDGG